MALIEKLNAIGDAIRSKTGKEDKLTLEQIATEIEGIQTGGGNSEIEDGLINKNLTYYYNERLTEIVTGYQFYQWKAALTAVFPNVTKVASNTFTQSIGLRKLDFHKLEILSSSHFIYQCNNFESLIIRTPKLCPLTMTNTFTGDGISKGTGYIYVPKALIEDYKVATNWINFAEQFRAIEDYPEICGGAEND